nr:immunoglobulin light chain junction region [Macaca mulatta]MPN99938.1 immunoglobulin light chain junction region [Macaca mulatta]MPO00415.1 immunoglobulin light chain junction region [Macaca mulatta]
YMQVLQTPFTF